MRVYKPSGIKWLGEIPQSWKNVSIRSCFTESNQRCNTDSYPLLSVTIANGIIYQDNIENKKDISNDDKSNYKIVPLNAVAYNKMRMWQGAVGVNTLTTGIVSPAYIVAIPNEKILPNFVSYLFKSKIMIGEFDKNSYGLCLDMNNLRYDDFRNIKIPLPPLQEQKEIAEFLDSKCEKIQNYIDKKQKLITLLQEKKQALINEAVTKGLNPNIESKNSGIEYLGLIPHHWEVKKLKHICKINPQANETLPNNFVYIDLESVIKGQLLKEQVINKEQAPSRAQRILQKQDILFQLVRPYQRNNYIFNKNGDYVASTGYAQIRTKECVNFVYYALLENSFVERVILKSTGSNYPAITSNDFADLKIPLPPLQEQKQIANFLDEKCEKINSVIEKTKKQIELVKEYKNTLINEAVCGRINLQKKERI
ncbi:restriction endonuclease subunit S [Campylobacter upsaliensis]|uniref:restriction endonuclease subunit S n=1 Tax=Campylobacter upsaliensis TaxID=28080 RepID=UPI00214A5DCB|nr:restriction endonuclease subunit S [Campylobacter upsaliensis]MCR2118798.1 restriction endonuclease subunit S [Campylobacter upsaliensis]